MSYSAKANPFPASQTPAAVRSPLTAPTGKAQSGLQVAIDQSPRQLRQTVPALVVPPTAALPGMPGIVQRVWAKLSTGETLQLSKVEGHEGFYKLKGGGYYKATGATNGKHIVVEPASLPTNQSADSDAGSSSESQEVAEPSASSHSSSSQHGPYQSLSAVYTSPSRQEPNSPVGHFTLENTDGTQQTIDELSPRSAARHMGSVKESGRQGEEMDTTPIATTLGGNPQIITPVAHTRDMSSAPGRVDDDGILHRGRGLPYSTLATSLDNSNVSTTALKKDVERQLLNQPSQLDSSIQPKVSEFASVLGIADSARGSHAIDLAQQELHNNQSFTQGFGGSNPSYIGAPKGGAKALKDFSEKKKKDEENDSD